MRKKMITAAQIVTLIQDTGLFPKETITSSPDGTEVRVELPGQQLFKELLLIVFPNDDPLNIVALLCPYYPSSHDHDDDQFAAMLPLIAQAVPASELCYAKRTIAARHEIANATTEHFKRAINSLITITRALGTAYLRFTFDPELRHSRKRATNWFTQEFSDLPKMRAAFPNNILKKEESL